MAVHDGVGVNRQLPEQLLPFRGFDIERDRELVHHLGDEVETAFFPGLLVGQHVLLSPEGGQLPHRIPPGRLDADHLGPGLGEQGGDELVPHPPQPDVQDLEPL